MEPLPLKDIHLPTAVSWWPPAPGWWLLVLLTAVLILAGYRVFKRLTRKTAIKHARKMLAEIRKQPGEQRQTLTAVSALLRRTAISTDHRSQVAGLQGRDWLTYLDRSFPEAPFSSGVGRCLADAHFRPQQSDDVDMNALLDLCERWLKQREKKS